MNRKTHSAHVQGSVLPAGQASAGGGCNTCPTGQGDSALFHGRSKTLQSEHVTIHLFDGMRGRNNLRQILLRKIIKSLSNQLFPTSRAGHLGHRKSSLTFLFSVMLKADHQVRDTEDFSLSCVHKSHGVYGSFGFFPSNQVLASSALARVESPRTR